MPSHHLMHDLTLLVVTILYLTVSNLTVSYPMSPCLYMHYITLPFAVHFCGQGRNFEKDQQAMKNQLFQLQSLVSFVDPLLANYLESHDSINMYFCFRWLLIVFKREFSFPDIMRLWEVRLIHR